MKTRFLKLCCLTFLLFTVFGCNDCSECEKDCNYISVSLDEVYTERGRSHDICNSKEAVIVPRSQYDTQLGTATLYIPVPKNHSLKKISQTNNSVSFVTSGKDFTNEFTLYKVDVEGFDKTPKAFITVNLEVTFTGADLCGPSTMSEKKKKSEVTGVPN